MSNKLKTIEYELITGKDFSKKRVENVVFKYCSFYLCDFSFALIQNSSFEFCIVEFCDFAGTKIKDSVFIVNADNTYFSLETDNVAIEFLGDAIPDTILENVYFRESYNYTVSIYRDFVRKYTDLYNFTIKDYVYVPTFTSIMDEDLRASCINHFVRTAVLNGCCNDGIVSLYTDNDTQELVKKYVDHLRNKYDSLTSKFNVAVKL